MSTTAFSLEVQNKEFTRALKRLSRCERSAAKAYLRYEDGNLLISLGLASENLPASGSWPATVAVSATWARALAISPYPVAVIMLRIIDGKLHARDYATPCEIVAPVTDEPAVAKATRKAHRG
jgi:hypothetical protein